MREIDRTSHINPLNGEGRKLEDKTVRDTEAAIRLGVRYCPSCKNLVAFDNAEQLLCTDCIVEGIL